MPRFRFTLEAVRELREQAETSAKESLARELALSANCEQRLEQARLQVAEARGALELAPDASIAAGDLKARQDFLERRELERALAALNAQSQTDRVEAGRKVLEIAATEREAVENIKRRRAREHEQAIERAELRLLDDLGLRNFGRPNPPAAA
jgi:flagellar export protein FliJ